MNIVIALLIFGLIIFIHEFGHFLLAKLNGIFVTEFSLGMGKRLISFIPTDNGYKLKILMSSEDFDNANEPLANTIYSLKLLPFGGSCMMLGEDESLEDDRAFNKKSVGARISVVFAGAFFNFILAFILSVAVIGILGYDPPIITRVANDSSAYDAGLEVGDLVTKIDNNGISISRDANSHFLLSPLTEKPVEITYERDGREFTTDLTPKYKESYVLGFSYLPDSSSASIDSIYKDYPMDKAGLLPGDIISKVDGNLIESGDALSIYFDENPLRNEPVEITYSRNNQEYNIIATPEYSGEGYELGYSINYGYVEASFLETIKYSFIEIKYNISTALKSFGMLVSGKAGANDIAGPVGIVSIIGDTYEASKIGGPLAIFINLASLTLMLSANVGIINLLPLPALDGGRLVFLVIELIRKKPVPAEKEGMVHFLGIMALMLLMIFVLYNDIRKIFPL